MGIFRYALLFGLVISSFSHGFLGSQTQCAHSSAKLNLPHSVSRKSIPHVPAMTAQEIESRINSLKTKRQSLLDLAEQEYAKQNPKRARIYKSQAEDLSAEIEAATWAQNLTKENPDRFEIVHINQEFFATDPASGNVILDAITHRPVRLIEVDLQVRLWKNDGTFQDVRIEVKNTHSFTDEQLERERTSANPDGADVVVYAPTLAFSVKESPDGSRTWVDGLEQYRTVIEKHAKFQVFTNLGHMKAYLNHLKTPEP